MLDLRAEQYSALKLTPSSLIKQLKDRAKIREGDVNAVRQRPPTAKGAAFVIIEGRVQRADNVINIVADYVLNP